MVERKPPGGDCVICTTCHARNSNGAKFCAGCMEDLKTNQNSADTGSANESAIGSESPSSNSTDGKSTASGDTSSNNPSAKSPLSTSLTDGTSTSSPSGHISESPSTDKGQSRESDTVQTNVTDRGSIETTFCSDKSNSDSWEMVATEDFSNKANDSAGAESVTSDSYYISMKYVPSVPRSDVANKEKVLPNPSHICPNLQDEDTYGRPPKYVLDQGKLQTSNENTSSQKNENSEMKNDTGPYDSSFSTEQASQTKMDVGENSRSDPAVSKSEQSNVSTETEADAHQGTLFGRSAAVPSYAQVATGTVAGRRTLFENDMGSNNADKSPMKPSANSNRSDDNFNKKDGVIFEFVIVVPPHIALTKDDNLFIVFNHHVLGGWKNPQAQFKLRHIDSFSIDLESHYHIYSLTTEIDRGLVNRYKIEYKYIILQRNGDSHFEFLHGENHSHAIVNRTLKLSDHKAQRLVRFDGCFEPEFKDENRGILRKIARLPYTAWKALFGSSHGSNVFDIVNSDHKLALQHLLPTFDKHLGFMTFDYGGSQQGKRLIAADVAVRDIRKMATDFKRNNRTLDIDCVEVLSNYFSEVLYTASLPNIDPMIRFTGVLVFIRCISLFELEGRNLGLAEPIFKKMGETPMNKLNDLCWLLSLTPNIDRTQLFEMAHSINKVVIGNSKTTNLHEAILDWMRCCEFPLYAVPFYHLIMQIPHYQLVYNYKCTDDDWWKSAHLRHYLHDNAKIERDVLKRIFYQMRPWLVDENEVATFLQTIICVYCNEPEHVTQLDLAQYDPILVVAWIAFQWRKSKYTSFRKFTVQYRILFYDVIQMLRDPSFQYEHDRILAFCGILESLLSVFDEIVDFHIKVGRELPPLLVFDITALVDSVAALLHNRYGENVSCIEKLKRLLRWPLKKSFNCFFPPSVLGDREFQVMITLGQLKMKEMGEMWVTFLCTLFADRRPLYQTMDAAQILEWYCECNVELVAEQFRTMLGMFIEHLIETNGEQLFNDKIAASICPEAKERLCKVVTSIFEKQWPKDDSPESDIVNHMLSWPLMEIVISHTEGDFKLLAPESVEKLDFGLSLVASTWEACINGNITLKNVYELWVKKDRFMSLIAKIHNTMQYEAINSTLEQLQNVRQKFMVLLNNTNALKFLLQSDEETTQVSYLDATASKVVDNILNTNTQLKIFSVASKGQNDEWQFASHFPQELEEVINMIRDRNLTESGLFNAFLKQQLTGQSLMSFDDLTSLVFKPVIDRLKHSVARILNGQMPLRDILQIEHILPSDHIRTIFPDEISSLCKELNIGDPSKVKLRVNQMLDFLKLRQISVDCTILNHLFQKLKLAKCQEEISDFDEIRANMEEKTLGEMTDDLTHVASTVQTITGNRGDCLKTLLKNWDFILCIRKIGKNEKELQNFVSIASTNVGESEIEIAMMSDFGKAVTGFSSLIYGIYREGMTLTQFLDEFLEPIWQALELDPKLPAKLSTSAKNAERIKSLKEATGSLETHSITKAAEINKSGVFTIGYLDKSTVFVNPDDCVKMMLKTEEKCWSMRELRDLRSKLMLIGVQMDKQAESRLDIDSFTKLFDAVAGLASLYIGHCKAGNVLLSQLHFNFNCDQNVSYQLMAKLQDQPPGFESKCTEQMNLVDQIGGISRFLEESLETWKDHLSKTRQKFPELNYFTSQQLVYLRHQVVQVKKEHCLDPATSFLLMSLQPNVNAKMVLSALDKSVSDMGNEENSEVHMAEKPKEDLRDFVDQLLKMGVEDEDVALRAIVAKGTDDMETALCWALDYMDDETEKDGMIKEVPSFMEKLSQLTEQLELCSETEPLAVQLKRVWCKYLEVHETRYKELMGLRQLGYLLRHLTSTTVLPPVACPALLKPNLPNLAILPEIHIPRYVLSLFAESGFEGLTYENVFVCNERTTAEELHLFLLRIQKPIERAAGCRLFSIVCIDRLTSEVCQAVEVDLNQDLRNAEHFGLVLICAEETSDRCHLAGVLSRYQLKVKDAMLPVNNTRRCVQKLLERQEHTGQLEADLLPRYYSGYLCTSIGYGHGKSEAVRKQKHYLAPHTEVLKIPVHTRSLDLDIMLSSLKKQGLVDPSMHQQRLIHLDILDHRVRRVDIFLFQLLILGGFVDSSGNVWRKLPNDCYAIEMTSVANEILGPTDLPANEFRFFVPVIQCHSPTMTKRYSDKPDLIEKECPHVLHKLLDKEFLQDERVQRCSAYLRRQNEDLTEFLFVPNQNKVFKKSLDILLENCGVKNPSWTELFHFIKFLNDQLSHCEKSVYFSPVVSPDLPGIKNFVVKFLIQMSKDFATRSLVISEDVSQLTRGQEVFEELEQYGLKHQWESKPHPYLFFNADVETSTISFFGCNFRRRGNVVDLTDSSEKKVIYKGIASRLLYDALINQTRHDRFANDFEQSFEKKNQQEKLLKLCRVLGLPDPRMPYDKPDAVGSFTQNPDPNYEITTDCALKMLAIEMRFRCRIPVVIMGETGCGKTRLIRYLCDLKRGGKNVENLIILRVHGGITADKIRAVVLNAIDVSKSNWNHHEVKTCLFFDEANTTTAISQIKEIVCDRTMDGEKLDLDHLDIIAAVNPYRRHCDEVIQKLEGAGLGYHVQDINSVEKFGDIPMRRLVYRVQPLPPSMIPFVWDFGRLTLETERIYITQLVNKFVSRVFPQNMMGNLKNIMVTVLTKTQQFMQTEQNESAFVSLRDVERTLIVMEWFWHHQIFLFTEMDDKLINPSEKIDPITRSLVLALCVCYRPSLQKKRGQFDELIKSCLKDEEEYSLADSSTVSKELAACQTVFIENVELEANIAKNEALKENLFMMVMCIELRIPLFLVGKPGSSKSLAKTIVDASMQGVNSPFPFFKQLKQAKLISYQCSPLASADGIEAIFRQCAREQQDVDLHKVVSVAVFDEIGLAEDSPKMPLKALHGLLEEGCVVKDEVLTNRHKPAFVGISNWALDPAKMNRGIFVNRVLPDKDELLRTAKHICRQGDRIYDLVGHLLESLTDSYLQLYEEQDKDYEFFGLRDFYSLVKMLFDIATKQHRKPSFSETMHAVTRNFSGTKGKNLSLKFYTRLENNNLFLDTDICDNGQVIDLIAENLAGLPNKERDNRFLLVLTENYAAMRALENLPQLHGQGDLKTPPALTIFGSSFPQDLEYTQICRNINKIKICMDTGRPIILLNLDTLYESLYDLLNQAFMMYSDERYVEMGLGNHRLKCHVNAKFRLIVVAEAEEVRRCFPSALINRLEKHYMSVRTDLKPGERRLADDLKNWAIEYTIACSKEKSSDPTDMFIGYNDDTAAVLISDVLLNSSKRPSDEDVVKFAKQKLLQCAIPESIYRYCENSDNKQDSDWVYKTYLNEQPHNCLVQFLKHWQKQMNNDWMMENKLMFQVTTHASSVLSSSEEKGLEEMAQAMGLHDSSDVHVLTLQDYDTDQQFVLALSNVVQRADECDQLLIIQCMAAEQNYKLVACSRYLIEDKIKECIGRLYVIQLLFLQRQPLCLSDMLHRWLNEGVEQINQITTHHKLVAEEDGLALALKCGTSIKKGNIEVVIDRDQELTKSLERCINRASAPENGIQLLIVQFLASERRQPTRLAAECRAEISRELTKSNSERVRVLLLISLPRIASFPGAHWDSFHLDDLVLESGDLVDIGAIHDRSISEIISNPDLIDTQKLIKECVCQAASKIQDDSSRKFQRIGLLAAMLENNDGFLDVLTRSLLVVLEENENRTDKNPTDWMAKEAANSTRILERRTFRQALRNRIETDIETILCKMLCLIDVAQNLNLITSPNFGYLWLQLFDDNSFVTQFHYQDLMFSMDEDHLKIQTSLNLVCNYPFSWLLKSHLDDMITTMDEVTDSDTPVARAERLSDQLRSTTWGSNVLNVAKMESMTAYIEDFVNYSVTCRSPKATKLIMEWLGRLTSEVMRDRKIVWPIAVHVVYQEIQDAIRRFVDFLELDRQLFHLLTDRELDACQYELDICVASLLVAELTELTKKLDSKDDLTDVMAKRLFEARKHWIIRLNVFSPVIHRLLNDQLSLGDNRARLRNNKIEELRDGWKTLEICASFLKHTMSVSYPFKVAAIYDLLINKTKDIGSEEFLKKFEVRSKAYNTFAFRHCYGVQCKIECASCQLLTSVPFSVLPCGHLIHEDCFEKLNRLECPLQTCQKELPRGFVLVPEPEKWKSVMECRTAVTTFFVDLVSQEIFTNQGPPSLAVTEKLMQYVTGKKTKGDNTTATLTPFSDLLGVDPSPVIRSYILQQLLKYNVAGVLEHIDAFVHNYDQYLLSDREKLDFLLICIGCVEDSLCADFAGLSQKACCRRLAQLLREIKAQKEPPAEIQETRVQEIAHMRCCLNVVTGLLPFINSHMNNNDVRACHFALSTYVKDCGNFGRNYLIRSIGRIHGVDYLRKLIHCNAFMWLNPGLILEDKETVADAYLVYGQNYFELRRSVIHGLLNIDQDLSQRIALEMTHNSSTSAHLVLSLLPVLSQFDFTNEQRGALVGRLCTSIPAAGLRTVADQVLNLFNPLLARVHGLTNNEMLTRLIYHAQVAFTAATGSLFKFFNMLVTDPASLRNSYFPTMWEDITVEQWNQLRQNREDSRATLNYCPNNHPYFITDCGAPNQSGHCGDCGAPIGGHHGAHTRAVGNHNSPDAVDQTKRGHCLGEVSSLGNQLPVERKMTRLETVLIRAIMHCAMLAAAATNKAVFDVITKGLRGANHIEQFLREHLEKDMTDLGRILNRGLDDCSYLVHAVLATITLDGSAQIHDPLLMTRESRANWENEFSRICLKPVYSDFNRILAQLRQSIANDTDNDPLWQLVYEDDLKEPDENDLSQLFQYRAPQTIEKLLHLAQEQINTSANRGDLVVLHDFVEQLNHLSAVRYLPSILRLHSFIRSEFHGSIDLATATNQTVTQFIESHKHKNADLESWIDDFFAAWRLVRDLVTKEQFALPDSHKNTVSYRITDEFIPDLVEPYSNPLLAIVPVPCKMGLGSCALIRSLIRLQNEFIVSHKTQIGLPEKLETVLLKHALAGGQILSFEIEHDVLQMLLMNRSFEFTVRSGTKTDVFDLFALQRQLVTKFLSQLVLLDSMMPLMKTRQNVLLECRQKLQNKIHQKELTEYQLRDLVNVPYLYGDMNRVKQCLDSAQLILRFASSITDFSPLDVTMCLADFLTEKLHKPDSDVDLLFRSYDISELNAVWSTLLFMYNVLVLVHDETGLFPNIPDVLKQPLPANVTRSLLDTLKKCDQLRFLSHLTSFITLYSDQIVANVTEATLEEGLEETFVAFEFEDDQTFALPDSVQLKHTVSCWRIAAEAFREYQDKM